MCACLLKSRVTHVAHVCLWSCEIRAPCCPRLPDHLSVQWLIHPGKSSYFCSWIFCSSAQAPSSDLCFFFFLAFFNYLKQDNCLILKNREINAFFFPFQSPETGFLKTDSENCINVIVQYFLDKQHIVWLRKGLDNHGWVPSRVEEWPRCKQSSVLQQLLRFVYLPANSFTLVPVKAAYLARGALQWHIQHGKSRWDVSNEHI